jgi:hypothetical protein
MNAVALTGALLNTCMSGKNQLKNVLGYLVRKKKFHFLVKYGPKRFV